MGVVAKWCAHGEVHVWGIASSLLSIYLSIYLTFSDLARPHSKGSLVRESPLFQGNLGCWNIIIWPDLCIHVWTDTFDFKLKTKPLQRKLSMPRYVYFPMVFLLMMVFFNLTWPGFPLEKSLNNLQFLSLILSDSKLGRLNFAPVNWRHPVLKTEMMLPNDVGRFNIPPNHRIVEVKRVSPWKCPEAVSCEWTPGCFFSLWLEKFQRHVWAKIPSQRCF